MKKAIILAILLVLSVVGVSASEVDVNMDVAAGEVDINASNSVESRSRFNAIGGFAGRFSSVDEGENRMDTTVDVVGNADLYFAGSQYLGDRNNNDNKGVFNAEVFGSYASMKFEMDNSEQQFNVRRLASEVPMLMASDNETGYGMFYSLASTEREGDYSNAFLSVTLEGIGTGALGKEKWGASSMLTAVGYNQNSVRINSGVVEATGDGVFNQYARGDNCLEMNGFTFGSGVGQFTANFGESLTGNFYSDSK